MLQVSAPLLVLLQMSDRKSKRTAVFGSPTELSKYGGRRSTESNGKNVDDVFEFRGWRFSSFHTKIVDSAEAASMHDSICARLGLERHECSGGTADSPTNAFNLRIPPMIFGHDVMKIEKTRAEEEKGELESVFTDGAFQLSLDAEDALTLWAEQHTTENLAKHGLNVIQVPYAAIWAKMNGLENGSESADAKQSPGRLGGESAAMGTLQIDRRSPLWDWTFSSDYCCTLGKRSKARQHIIGVKNLFSPVDASDPLLSCIQQASFSGVDYDALRANDVPILFYDEILLYQDDLEDCGEVVFEAKLRVMPHCWFLLSRMFLRVDGVLLRIRDSRFFHKFGTDAVHLEVTWKECKLGLKLDKGAGGKEEDDGRTRAQGGAPSLTDGVLYIDGSSMRDINKLAQLCPVISSHNSSFSV